VLSLLRSSVIGAALQGKVSQKPRVTARQTGVVTPLTRIATLHQPKLKSMYKSSDPV